MTKIQNLKQLRFKYLAIIFLIILSVLFFMLQQKNNNSLYPILKKEGFNLELVKNFKITKDHIKQRPLSQRIVSAEDSSGDIIKLKLLYNISGKKAKEYVDDQKVILTSLYEPALPPYPEFIGQEITCDKKYKPIFKEHKFGQYYLLFAGERFGYGICEKNMIKYKAFLGYFYCEKEKKLLKIEYFIDQGSDFYQVESFFKNISCK